MSIANELITRGWHQGGYMGHDGTVCLYGAAMCAAGHAEKLAADIVPDELTDYDRALMSVLGHEGAPGAVVDFNDDPERTFDEVLRVAKEADELLAQ